MGWLSGWLRRKAITYAGAASAGAGYVVFVKAYAGSGIDGTEALTGGHNGVTATKIYLPTDANADFSNVCFTGDDGETLLDHFRDTYTASTSALFAVEVAKDITTGASFYMYWGGGAGASSAANTFRRVISSGIVLSLPMNEGSGNCTDYSGNGKTLTVNGALWVATGKFGNALSFDGNNDTATTVAYQSGNSESRVYYINPTAFAAWKNHIVHSDSIATGAAKPYYQVWISDANKSVYTDNAYNLAAWNNMAATLNWDGANSTLKFYQNNTFAGAPTTYNKERAAVNQILTLGNAVASFAFVMSGYYQFNYALSAAEISDLDDYYPQCSSGNLGKLYLRAYVNPEPQPSSVGTMELPPDPAGTYGTFSPKKKTEPLGPPVPEPPIPREFFVKVRDWLRAKTERDS